MRARANHEWEAAVMDALNELKRLHDMMVQYRDAIQRWDAEIMHADETAEQIRDLRTQLQRAYAKLEDTFAKWGGVSLPRYPLFAAAPAASSTSP